LLRVVVVVCDEQPVAKATRLDHVGQDRRAPLLRRAVDDQLLGAGGLALEVAEINYHLGDRSRDFG